VNDSHPSSEPPPPQDDSLDELGGLSPKDLFAEGLHTPPAAGKWLPPSAEHVAQLLPQYRVEALIGHGGMGAVYQGAQPKLERLIAIKLLPAELAGDIEFVARFEREARTLAKLHHPNIVSIYDFGQTSEGHLYFVMEFVNGTDLARLIASGAMDAAQALQLTIQVCDALNYAHNQHVIHRDIKPANVLVTQDGHAKLADFGLARPLDEQDFALTASNLVMGTPDYMAPEQRAGMGDHRVDIYALGVMLYEMLTGQRPKGVFDPPSMKVQVDVRLDEVVVKAMREEPERRYQQASEMRMDVDRIRSTPQPKAASPNKEPKAVASKQTPTVTKRPSKTTPRSWIAPLAILVLLAILAAIAVKKHWLGSSPEKPAAAEQPKAEPSSWAALTTATKDAPFGNSFGMKFVPVPIKGGPTHGQPVLFSIWDTRVEDYEVFAKETQHPWGKAVFEQGPTHPAVNVSWDDAQAYCQWLTAHEQKAGRLPVDWRYRLPSDHEWSCAVDIGEREDATRWPDEKNGQIGDLFPWGTQWPPPPGAGNFAGEELTPAMAASQYLGVIANYRDAHVNTSPVGSFAPNRFGLYDMGGNVQKWCGNWFEKEQKNRTLRGSSWNRSDRGVLVSSYRSRTTSNVRSVIMGFRCVLAPAPAVPSQTNPGSAGNWFSLLPLVDTTADAVKGTWSRTPDGLRAESKGPGILQMPYEPGEEYDFRMVCTALEGSGEATQTLAAKGRQFRWSTSGGEKDKKRAGFARVGGDALVTSPASILLPAEPLLNRRFESLIEVRRDRVTAYLDGKKMVEWKTDYHEMNLDQGLLLPNAKAIAVGNWGNILLFHDISVREVSGKGTLLRASSPVTFTPDIKTFRGHRYQLVMVHESWESATQKAQQMGGHLATISSKEEDEWLQATFARILAPKKGLWIGASNGSETARRWSWVTDEPFAYANWLPGEGHEPGPRGACYLRAETDGLLGWADTGEDASGFMVSGYLVEWEDEGAGNAPPRASKDIPFVNSLGMKFVPVPGTNVLFCIHETRRQDYTAYSDAVPGLNKAWQNMKERRDVPIGHEPNHPVVGVTWSEAQQFCRWLSAKEGRTYRLPTDEEWSIAVGIAPKENRGPGSTPRILMRTTERHYPWGDSFPPPPGSLAGNYGDVTYTEQINPQRHQLSYRDGFATTAPVMSFRPNALGLYDLGGNVWEWVEDWWDVDEKMRVMRGASYQETDWFAELMASSGRRSYPPESHVNSVGFRIIIDLKDRAAAPQTADGTDSSRPSAAPMSADGSTIDPALAAALLSADWSFDNTDPKGNHWQWAITFRKDGSAIAHDDATGYNRTWHWWITGPRTLHVHTSNEPEGFDPKVGFDWKFNDSLTSYEGLRLDYPETQKGGRLNAKSAKQAP